MIETRTAFPMYDFPEIAGAHDRLWTAIATHVRRAGLTGDIPLTQVCGYPLIRSMRGLYDVVAAPMYALPFCERAAHCALIVVASGADHARLEDLRNARFALNAPDSNTGMNLPRRLIAPLARGGRFFREVTITGSHAASIEAVGNGEADAASIDAVTFALLAQYRPRAVARIRVLTATAPSPAPAFVIPRGAGPHIKALLYDALAAALADANLGDVRRALHLTGISPAARETYDLLAQYEEEAAALGYAVLA